MPNRILREGIITSERVASLDWAAEVFYRRLHSVVDDFGRYYANPSLLRAACYPLQLDKVSDSDIGKWLACAQKAALVRVYPAKDGKRYIELLDFRQQVRATKSRFPDPLSECEADANQLRSRRVANAHLDVDVDVDVSEDAKPVSSEPAHKPRRSKPAAQWNGATVCMLPVVGSGGSEIAITQEFIDEMQQAYPAVDCLTTLREIRAWCLANPGKRKTAGGAHRFVQSWFAREQNRG